MMTIAEAAKRMAISQSLLYRLVAREEIECYRVGENCIRLSWDAHILPYLERTQKKKPRLQKLSSKKGNLKHLSR